MSKKKEVENYPKFLAYDIEDGCRDNYETESQAVDECLKAFENEEVEANDMIVIYKAIKVIRVPKNKPTVETVK